MPTCNRGSATPISDQARTGRDWAPAPIGRTSLTALNAPTAVGQTDRQVPAERPATGRRETALLRRGMCDPIGRLVDSRIVERPEPLIFGRLRALAVVEGRGSPAEDVGLPLSAAAVAAVAAFAVAADAVVGAGRTSGSSTTSCCSVGSTTVLVTTASHTMAATSPMSG